jgi:CRISPR/Cas system-associated exonuclease Cas4 (RecB family)
MKTIRASEIGTYLYCQRAWWYRKNGYEPQNQVELAAGVELHEGHGRTVLVTGLLRLLGYATLLVALLITVVTITMQLIK